jgi:hypothetical protein
MMKCDKVLDLLPHYIEGLLKPAKGKKVADHLSECSRCKREEMELRRAIELASSLQVEYPDEEKWDRFLTDLHRRIEEEMLIESLRKPAFSRFLPVAGFAALIISVFLLTMTVGIKLSPLLGARSEADERAVVEQADIRPYLSVLIDKVQVRQIERITDLTVESEPQSEIYMVSDEADTSLDTEGGVQTGDKDVMDVLIGPELIGPLDYGEIGYEPNLVSARISD